MPKINLNVLAQHKRAAATLESLEDCKDDFIVMGLSEKRHQTGMYAVQLVCFQPREALDYQHRLIKATDQRGNPYAQKIITDPYNGEERAYPTMRRTMLTPRLVGYDIIGTGTNVEQLSKHMMITGGYLKQLPRFKERKTDLRPDPLPPYRPQVTGIIGHGQRRALSFGFSALRHRNPSLFSSKAPEALTAEPYELTYTARDLRPGIGLLVTNAILHPDEPRPPLDTVLRPSMLPGSIDEIAAAYFEQSQPGSIIAVKQFKPDGNAECLVLPPKPLG